MALAKGMHNQLGRANRSENRAFLLLLMPFMGLFFIFTILPIVSSIVLSFTDYDMINTPRFTGLSNYLRMFTTDEVFPVAVKNGQNTLEGGNKKSAFFSKGSVTTNG